MKIVCLSPIRGIADRLQRTLALSGDDVNCFPPDRSGPVPCRLDGACLLVVEVRDEAELDVIPALRSAAPGRPVLALAPGDRTDLRIAAFRAGADQVCPPDIDDEELAARVHALVRVRTTTAEPSLEYGALRLDRRQMRLSRDGKPLEVRGKALSLIEFLMRHPETLHSRQTLGLAVWGPDFDASSKSFEVYLSRLRSTIDRGFPEPYLHTIRGRGYMLARQQATAAAQP